MKRAVLLEGSYGSGKTMALYLTGQMSVSSGLTFILCRPEDDLMQVLQTARLYMPSVVAFEDLDIIAEANPNTDNPATSISLVLDRFDGMRAKGLEILCVLTTNHVEKLHKGMIRPGRLDGIIKFGLFDRPAVEGLIEVLVGGALSPTVDWDPVWEAYQNLMPAFIKEAAERSVRYGLMNADEPVITERELILGAHSLETQLELMADAPEMSERDRLGVLLERVAESGAEKAIVKKFGA